MKRGWNDETIISDGIEMEESRQSVRECNSEKLGEERKDFKRMGSERIETHNENRKAVRNL